MASPAERRAQLLEAAYRTWGEPAGWISSIGEVLTGIRVRRMEEDAPVDFGSNSRAIVERIVLRVRASEVPRPAKGDRVEILDGDGGVIAAYLVADRPQRLRFGMEWKVEAEEAI
ncbi:hypothetical protein CA606_18195 [Caulobacter vibrioides]|uniref:Uncharacterized protein n=1 Tax=Caulobacter vibrioides TaxID=155892 RepID=A0A290MQQ7_CAUVI|nr:hypothetical protein [Caulobacter vibrioides]ATC34105.1 hypothetical protein CA606_18195 [Caulobacter vibrioides]